MKSLIKNYLLLALAFLFIQSCAGTKDLAPDGSEIPLNVNLIIAHIDSDQESAFQNVGQFLIQKGYSIESSSPEFYTLRTNFREATAGSLDAWANISISASVISINGNTQINFTGTLNSALNDNEPIKQYGQSGSVMRVAWDEFYKTVKSYSDNLTFEIR